MELLNDRTCQQAFSGLMVGKEEGEVIQYIVTE
jgi:hypothetical protein